MKPTSRADHTTAPEVPVGGASADETPPVEAPAEPRPSEAAAEVARIARWLAGRDLAGDGDGECLATVEALAPVLDLLAHTQVEALTAAQDAIPAREGLLADAWLGLVARRSGADRRTLLVAAEVLPTLPRIRAAARSGAMSWSEVRVICLRAAPLTAEQRTRLDVAVAGDPDALRRMGADQTLELADQVVDGLRPVDLVKQEQREFAAQFVALRGRLDGTGQIHGDLDSVAFTDIAGRVTTLADQLPAPPDTPDDTPAWTTRGLRQALALHALVTATGDDREPSAKVLVTVDGARLDPDLLERITATAIPPALLDRLGDDTPAATLHHRRGRRPMSSRQLWRIIGGAQLRLLLTTNGVPLKLGRTTRLASTAQRDAAATLYGGCAWPACPAPFAACELHHVTPWHPPHYGRTDDDNLAPLCGVHHHAITHGKWSLTLRPDRSVEVRRGRRRHRSLPRGLLRARSPATDPPGSGSDPPGPHPPPPPAAHRHTNPHKNPPRTPPARVTPPPPPPPPRPARRPPAPVPGRHAPSTLRPQLPRTHRDQHPAAQHPCRPKTTVDVHGRPRRSPPPATACVAPHHTGIPPARRHMPSVWRRSCTRCWTSPWPSARGLWAVDACSALGISRFRRS